MEKAALNRIVSRAAELMVVQPDWPVRLCVYQAELEEQLIYGSLIAEEPCSLIGYSPLQGVDHRGTGQGGRGA
jgi:hypothetical protein